MGYNIEYLGDAQEFRSRISFLMEKNSGDFENPFTDRSKGFEQVVDDYVDGKEMIAAIHDGDIVGLLLFTKGGYRKPIAEYCPCLYVNLTMVDRGFRNQGLAHRMYGKLLKDILPESEYDVAGVRTQKVNPPSRRSIEHAGFEEAARDTENGEYIIYYIYRE